MVGAAISIPYLGYLRIHGDSVDEAEVKPLQGRFPPHCDLQGREQGHVLSGGAGGGAGGNNI